MNDQVEVRLRAALTEAGDTVQPVTLRALAPPQGSRVQVHTRLLVVAMIVLPLAVGAATLLRPTDRDSQLVAMGVMGMSPSRVLGPEDPEIAVYICEAQSPFRSCSGSHGATPQQIAAIEQALRAMPQVESITFRDQQTTYELFVEHQANSTLAQIVEPTDMPESFRLKMKEDTDWTPTLEAAVALPGVSNVINEKCISEYLAGDSDNSKCSVGVIFR
ncbi:hypothetical protein GCM10009555_084630 [Acrocarpospora macrocephala]|uniref:FtsX extracellular domain-containing protein n=1 Tax=Acrocarpospora macrocephala TaxID=150177 RepID=A0A5M3X3K8_9ACTN|nr:permease-like cell division protein FtsX [Acrocarpospora macrocephala]GES14221.1 hypothetical protein Amac_078180 [Acrocarpospora macrocephala]